MPFHVNIFLHIFKTFSSYNVFYLEQLGENAPSDLICLSISRAGSNMKLVKYSLFTKANPFQVNKNIFITLPLHGE